MEEPKPEQLKLGEAPVYFTKDIQSLKDGQPVTVDFPPDSASPRVGESAFVYVEGERMDLVVTAVEKDDTGIYKVTYKQRPMPSEIRPGAIKEG